MKIFEKTPGWHPGARSKSVRRQSRDGQLETEWHSVAEWHCHTEMEVSADERASEKPPSADAMASRHSRASSDGCVPAVPCGVRLCRSAVPVPCLHVNGVIVVMARIAVTCR